MSFYQARPARRGARRPPRLGPLGRPIADLTGLAASRRWSPRLDCDGGPYPGCRRPATLGRHAGCPRVTRSIVAIRRWHQCPTGRGRRRLGGCRRRRTRARSAPLDLLERVAVAEPTSPRSWACCATAANLQESVLLSTCLRTEVYAVVDRFHDAVRRGARAAGREGRDQAAELEPYVAVRFDDDVAAHLFSVAAGLESAVLGECEVLGQVRRAWEHAHDERVSGPVLAGLFRHAVETGKRVRSETAIARGTTSFSPRGRGAGRPGRCPTGSRGTDGASSSAPARSAPV